MSRDFIFTIEEIIKIKDYHNPPLMSDGRLHTIQRTTGTALETSDGEFEVIIEKQEVLIKDEYIERDGIVMSLPKSEDKNLFKKLIRKIVK